MPIIDTFPNPNRKRDYEVAYSYTEKILKRINFEQLIKNPNVIYIILDTYFALFKKDEF